MLLVEGLNVGARTHDAVTPIVRNVSFALSPGEALGIVGESGSGKSMTLRAVRRTLSRTFQVGGIVEFEGRNVYEMSDKQLRAWHGEHVAMIYQDPRANINPVRTIGDFLTETLRRRMSRSDAAIRAVAQLEAVGISNAADRMAQYPHQLSGGLLQRVMIAAGLLDDPKLLMADEPTTALDVTTQEEVMAILNELRQQRGLGLLLVTHDLDLAASVSDRVATMYAGELVELGGAKDLHARVRHPYSRALLDSRPSVTTVVDLQPIPGTPARAADVTHGCSFASRCPHALELCREQTPQLAPSGDRLVACLRVDDLAHFATTQAPATPASSRSTDAAGSAGGPQTREGP
jgi:oligopeptide/dipeptide ABC transporter ATP-binding protein